jgi:chemotaxis protein MotA
MERKKILGLFCCVALIGIGFALHGNIGLYFNIAAFLIVVGGTLGATLISFRMKRLSILWNILKASSKPMREPDEIVEILIDLSVKSKIRGLLSLQEDEGETSILFLRRALGFVVDAYPAGEISDILYTEMSFFKARRDESERVLRTMAEICPSFGLVGSVVGLIGMFSGVGDTSIILATIPVALTSTLYGVIFANFFLLPFAANVRERTNQELLLQKIILEGVLAIQNALNPRILEVKLKSYLTPSSRNVKLVSIERIRDKFKIKPGLETHSRSVTPPIRNLSTRYSA